MHDLRLSIRFPHRLLFAIMLLLASTCSIASVRGENAAELWDMKALEAVPKVTWDQTRPDGVKSLYYEGEPYMGKPTRIFAYYAQPENPKGKLPAMVLVHGGGGTAFPQWCKLWADRGYAAIAIDLGGVGPDKKRLEDGGPGQGDKEKFEDIKTGLKNAWTYHAVANIVRAHSLLRSMPDVDPDRTGLTGISWGGYLTCMVSGVDHRYKVAVPVYGCGFLHENSTWLNNFKRLGTDHEALWVKHYDPSSLLVNAKLPMLFVNGTNDFAYPLDSYKKSYHAVQGPRTLCVTVRMPHGHEAGWNPKEIGLFVDGYLADEKAKPFAQVSTITRKGVEVSATVQAQVPIKSASLHYTTDQGEWKLRKWETIDAKVDGDSIRATLPAEKSIVYFMTVVDERGVTVSTEHEVIE